jgi:hypothetical protein
MNPNVEGCACARCPRARRARAVELAFAADHSLRSSRLKRRVVLRTTDPFARIAVDSQVVPAWKRVFAWTVVFV